MSASPLVLLRSPGRRARLASPIPDEAVVALPLLTSMAVREWVVVTGDDALAICGHAFTVVGWDCAGPDGDSGLIIAHGPCPECEAP